MKKLASLIAEIEVLRDRLNVLITLYGEKNEDVLHCSQELDELISEYHRSKEETKKSAVRAPSFQLKSFCFI